METFIRLNYLGQEVGATYTPYTDTSMALLNEAGCLSEGEFVYQKVGVIRKRPKVKEVPEQEFTVGKNYSRVSSGTNWKCIAKTSEGNFIFKYGDQYSSVLIETDSSGKRVTSPKQPEFNLDTTEKVVGEEWYIDTTGC